MNQKEIKEENKKRLDVLHRKHRTWLNGVAFKITRNKEETEDIISELYMYLLEKGEKRHWFNESFNLMYCRSFIHTRYLNKIKRQSKFTTTDEFYEEADEEYDYEWDKLLEQKYDEVIGELDKLNKTKMWSSALLFKIYMFNDFTMSEVSESVGVSRSTVFLNNKKIKQFLKQKIQNPFSADESNKRQRKKEKS